MRLGNLDDIENALSRNLGCGTNAFNIIRDVDTIDPETLPIVKELRAENKKLTEALRDSFAIDLMNKLDKAEKERNAAVNDLKDCAVEDYAECMYCSHRNKGTTLCQDCIYGSNWEWRGIVEKE